MKNLQFYKCEHCGNIIQVVYGAAVPVMCCGQPMTELVANTSDGAVEKHVPVVEKEGSKVIVTVGSVNHPMLEEHYIEWIYVETDKGYYRKALHPGQEPKAEFNIGEEELKEVYAYCNLHGLWKASRQRDNNIFSNIKHPLCHSFKLCIEGVYVISP